MASLRTDSAAGRAAMARRKQRGRNEPLSTLLARSSQVGDEAAKVLASVRKQPANRSNANENQQRVQRVMEETEKNVHATSSSSNDSVLRASKTSSSDGEDYKPAAVSTSSGKPSSQAKVPSTQEKTEMGKEDQAADDVFEEELRTVEELEPLVEDAIVDASCFARHTTIMIRSHTLGFFRVQDDDTVIASDPGLNYKEIFEIINWRDSVLRYGDSILLSSTSKDSFFLGARAVPTLDRIIFQVQLVKERQSWTVLRACDIPVRIGQSAVDNPFRRQGLTAPVRSGDRALLRHVSTGGILTLPGERLLLLTDSYDRDDPPQRALMDRIQTHDLLVPSSQDIFHLMPPTVPPTPLWVSGSALDKRPYQDGSYLLNGKRHEESVQSRKHLSIDYASRVEAVREEQLQTPRGQEMLLIDELLASFIGLEGSFIKVHSHDRELRNVYFELQETPQYKFDPSLKSVVKDMLPLATSFARVNHFCLSRILSVEYGGVMSALCNALDGLLQEYMCYIASLGNQQEMSLRRLQGLIQPSLHTMGVLERATRSVHDKIGGALLNALRRLKVWTFDGDSLAAAAMQILLDKASAPYLHMLSQWLEQGILEDPYNEFLVRIDENQPWEHRYELVEEHILDGFFSTQSTVERTLAAGKYWNAVSACERLARFGRNASSMGSGRPENLGHTELTFGTTASEMSSHVQNMYFKASNSLERIMMGDFDLMGSLRLVKRYFLLDQGDFFVNFQDLAETELMKEISRISLGRIQHWLKTSIQLTESNGKEGVLLNSAKSKEDKGLNASALRCRFLAESLVDQLDTIHAAQGGIDTHEPNTPQRHAYGGMVSKGLTGIDAFIVEFSAIPFPLSIVLSKSTLSNYQLLFRHLFFAKHVERRLVAIWQDHQVMKELQNLRGSFGQTFLLRQRMLHFMQNLIYYMMFEVIEPKWREMEDLLKTNTASVEGTVDGILDIHNTSQKRILEACLLTNRDLIRALTKLMTTCLMFADQMKRFMAATKVEDDQRIVAIEKQQMVQQSINNRCSIKEKQSHEAMHKTLQKARADRQQRVHQQTVRVGRELSSENYQRMVNRFEEVFSDNLREFMVQLTQSDDLYYNHKVNLCIQLDYNGFVTDSLGLKG